MIFIWVFNKFVQMFLLNIHINIKLLRKNIFQNVPIYSKKNIEPQESPIKSVNHAHENHIKFNNDALFQNALKHFFQSPHFSRSLKKKIAFLELLLNMKMLKNSAFLSDDDVREEVNTFMFEGHDTTTAAICFTLVLLSRHKEVQGKVFEELINLTKTQTDICSYENLQMMKYLECVIKESLRLFPSVPVIGRELYEDVYLPSGYMVPAGAVLLISMYFLHRNDKYFSNPEVFNPDNFLHENSINRHPYAYIPFSAGPRNCIGQKFAMLELKSILSKIILNFVIEPADESWDVVEDPNIVFQSVSGHKVKLRKRTNCVIVK